MERSQLAEFARTAAIDRGGLFYESVTIHGNEVPAQISRGADEMSLADSGGGFEASETWTIRIPTSAGVEPKCNDEIRDKNGRKFTIRSVQRPSVHGHEYILRAEIMQ